MTLAAQLVERLRKAAKDFGPRWDHGPVQAGTLFGLLNEAADFLEQHPVSPEAAFREGYDFGQADRRFDVTDADGAWAKSGTKQGLEQHPVAQTCGNGAHLFQQPEKQGRCRCGAWRISVALGEPLTQQR